MEKWQNFGLLSKAYLSQAQLLLASSCMTQQTADKKGPKRDAARLKGLQEYSSIWLHILCNNGNPRCGVRPSMWQIGKLLLLSVKNGMGKVRNLIIIVLLWTKSRRYTVPIKRISGSLFWTEFKIIPHFNIFVSRIGIQNNVYSGWCSFGFRGHRTKVVLDVQFSLGILVFRKLGSKSWQ